MDEHPSWHGVLEGVGVAFLLLFAVFLLAFAAFDTWAEWGPNGPTSAWTDIPMFLLSFIGLAQTVYIVPIFFFFRRRGMSLIAQGILLGAGIILLINLAAYAWWTRG